MFWKITFFPRSEYHVFLSHCAEDRDWLVNPLHEALKRNGIIPWLDQEDYYYGRDSRTALRDGLLRSRHVVFLITRRMMEYSRGWCQMELGYGDLIRMKLVNPGGPLLNFELPLFFIDRNDPDLPRTAWDVMRDRGRFHHPRDGDAVEWTIDQVAGFLRREQRLASDLAKVSKPGDAVHRELTACPGLLERVTLFDPGPIADVDPLAP